MSVLEKDQTLIFEEDQTIACYFRIVPYKGEIRCETMEVPVRAIITKKARTIATLKILDDNFIGENNLFLENICKVPIKNEILQKIKHRNFLNFSLWTNKEDSLLERYCFVRDKFEKKDQIFKIISEFKKERKQNFETKKFLDQDVSMQIMNKMAENPYYAQALLEMLFVKENFFYCPISKDAVDLMYEILVEKNKPKEFPTKKMTL